MQESKRAVTFGVLGLSRGYWLARAIAQVEGAELAAICSRQPERAERVAARFPGVRSYTSYEALLDSDLDAVIVATPPAFHVPHTVQALRAGKHVLSEVPAATSFEQCDELLAAVRATDRSYMLAENFCYMRPWSLVQALVAAGVFGELYYGEADLLAPIDFAPPDAGSWLTAEWAMRQGHPYLTHYWGPLYRALGEPLATVECRGSGQHHRSWAKADDTTVVLGNTASGKLVRLRVDFFSPHPTSGYIGLQGTEAAAEICASGGDADQRVYVKGRSEAGTWQSLWDYAEYLPPAWSKYPPDATIKTLDSGLPLMIEEFAHSIVERRASPIGVVDALRITAPALASEMSRAQGRAVEVPDYGSAGRNA